MYQSVVKLQLNSHAAKSLVRLNKFNRVFSIDASGSKKQLNNLNECTNAPVYRENFASRHIGVLEKDQADMLKTLNLKVKFILFIYLNDKQKSQLNFNNILCCCFNLVVGRTNC